MTRQELIAALAGYRRPGSPRYEHHFRKLPATVLRKRNVPALLAILSDTSLPPMVREHAAGALGEIGDKRTVEPLIQALGETRLRRGVAVALGRMQAKAAARPLKGIAPRSQAARWALSQLGLRGSVEEVLEDLRCGHLRLIGPKIKRLTAREARAVSNEICRELRAAVSRDALDPSHRWLVTALQFLAPPEAGDLLTQALRSTRRRKLCPSVRTRLLRAVAAIRPPQILPVLLEIAQQADYPYHRRLAAACMKKIESPRRAPPSWARRRRERGMHIQCREMTPEDYGVVECWHWASAEQVEEYIHRQGIASMLAFDGQRYLGQLYFQEYNPEFREPRGWDGDRCWADFAAAEPLGLCGRYLTLGCYHVGWMPDGRRDKSLWGRGIGTALLQAVIEWLRTQSAIDGLISWGLVPGSIKLLVKAGQMPYTVYERLGFRQVRQMHDPRWTDFVTRMNTAGATGDPSILRVLMLPRVRVGRS